MRFQQPLKSALATGCIAAALMLVSVAQATNDTPFGDGDRAHANSMLDGTRKDIEKRYYDATYHGVDIAANAEVAKSRIAKADSPGEAFAAIAQFALELNDSHTFFIPPRQTATVEYGWDFGMVGDVCYVLRVNPDSDAANQGVKRGDRVTSINGMKLTRESQWTINYLFRALRPQPGLHVELVTPTGSVRELNIAAKATQRKKVVDLTSAGGADSAQYLLDQEKYAGERKPIFAEIGKQVLVVRVPSFSADESSIRDIARRAVGHDSLIVDLRGNGGGAVINLQTLLGGISATDVVIGTVQEREHSEMLTAKSWGNGAFAGRIFVLIDAESASASELFARAVQLTSRGTVIGDRSAGAVMRANAEQHLVMHGANAIVYFTSVTSADIKMSDGGRLEKYGVIPDLQVVPSALDMAAGRDPVLAQALQLAGHPLDAVAAANLLPNEK